ncbi:radical S-adenosyl methionine domain-containing protein 2 [Capsaspora owczarzaki ATCC 30864]|uniref:Radical S-adenosyl methionine domain-containing protein 2 n=1 Tax=Capsaspora owczarzaki (strain ATCC 30864) TaxID=595528 RepID=A0A0D2WNQ6_CAPO3|nr:radical S-adenosyl methionine domain-containing protein 2 [Capsaspora owczarzaki ATCC 30864]KJE92068.1 radical S-adenosyl methionine domain-containing protein 2 [Capsaspora owczarzaki ATCC 30864]|eukprot:XP_004363934.1 radical S-adenosyl methionine domain-containing protein 2 [Capsaspora owczarzaki ATCC 30864]
MLKHLFAELIQCAGSSAIYSYIALVVVGVVTTLFYMRNRLRPSLGGTEAINCSANAANVVSVNYHFTRQCNYSCKFCFHTAKTSHLVPIEEACRGMKLLKEAGMRKINFSGGEPFLIRRGKQVGQMVRYAKETLQLESVTIVTNGSLVTEEWFEQYGQWLDIMAISCDSFDEGTNELIGRTAANAAARQVEVAYRVQELCGRFGVKFKLNTVVNTHNVNEDMTEHIARLQPARWKVFQCLLIDGENAGGQDLRDARALVITDDQFAAFLARHKALSPIAESNSVMRNSYVIVDEYFRFLNNVNGSKEPSMSILDKGVQGAWGKTVFDQAGFVERSGEYEWTRLAEKNSTGTSTSTSTLARIPDTNVVLRAVKELSD